MSDLRLDLNARAPLVVQPHELARADARDLARRLVRGLPHAHLAECRHGTAGDLVVLDVDVETPQHTVHDIRMQERIGAWFDASSEHGELEPPEAFALREDFPAALPHTNLRWFAYPKSLCLYDVSFEEVRSQWTPARYVALIREWLRLTALGRLHAADQPLEPLMFGTGWIILPNVFREGEDGSFSLAPRGVIHGRPVLVAVPPNEIKASERPWVVATFRAQPRVHGVIHRAPRNLRELNDLLAPEDDLRSRLIAHLRAWHDEGVKLEALLAVVLLIPMQRSADSPPEVEHPWAFLSGKSLAESGESLGIWQRTSAGLAILVPPNAGDGGESIELSVVNAHFHHRREDAARFNGRACVEDRAFLAIGAGALGSQVLASLARAAFGRWTVVDGDVLLPHNLSRHQLDEGSLGWEKAQALARGAMAAIADDGAVHDWIAADVLRPRDQRDALDRAYRDASAIVDMSTSIAVARKLARDVVAPARRVSIFLNPTGRDLMLLAEPADRAIRLDAIEMQYYRAVIRLEALQGTLSEAASQERYGRSCRDVSSRLPHALLKMFAGMATQALPSTLAQSRPQLRVWRFHESSMAVDAIEVPLYPVIETQLGDWIAVVDEGLMAELRAARDKKLPNETGGVLLGTIDLARRVVYVVDFVASPPDSEEWPTCYIRGATGLKEQVERIYKITGGQLHYVGEWHSHPKGYSPYPSADDVKVFTWITEALDVDDLPGVMMIVAEGGTALFVGSISRDVPATVLRLGIAEPLHAVDAQ